MGHRNGASQPRDAGQGCVLEDWPPERGRRPSTAACTACRESLGGHHAFHWRAAPNRGFLLPASCAQGDDTWLQRLEREQVAGAKEAAGMERR